jgi:hypothetical protein
MAIKKMPARNRVDVSGKKFGRWKALKLQKISKTGVSYYECLCECGAVRVVARNNLASGMSRSCGCLKRESTIKYNKENKVTHGLAKTKALYIWQQMLHRCYLEKNSHYKSYGGRGIKVCKRWHDPTNFFEDMGEPLKGMSLDRIDNNKGYYKENCRWATREDQANNKRTNRIITVNGENLTMAQAARKYSISYDKLKYRIYAGWPPNKAVVNAR